MLPGLVLQQLQQLAASSRVGATLVILQWLLLVAGRLRKATSSAGPSSAASAAAADTAAAVAASSVQLAAQIACCVPEQLPDSCLAYLGAPGPSTPSPPAAEPYTELNASYAQMRRELYALMNVCLEVREGCLDIQTSVGWTWSALVTAYTHRAGCTRVAGGRKRLGCPVLSRGA